MNTPHSFIFLFVFSSQFWMIFFVREPVLFARLPIQYTLHVQTDTVWKKSQLCIIFKTILHLFLLNENMWIALHHGKHYLLGCKCFHLQLTTTIRVTKWESNEVSMDRLATCDELSTGHCLYSDFFSLFISLIELLSVRSIELLGNGAIVFFSIFGSFCCVVRFVCICVVRFTRATAQPIWDSEAQRYK